MYRAYSLSDSCSARQSRLCGW